MTFEPGDVVQITKNPKHDLYGMFGLVTGVSDNGSYMVFLNFGPKYSAPETRIQGIRFTFSEDEITKIGVNAAKLDIAKINKNCDNAQKAVQAANPDLVILIKHAEEARKWKHLPFGSPEAKEHGCVCGEVRNPDCFLHGHTLEEVKRASRVIENIFDVDK
ncbi:MAG: hypothetical protein JST89_12230 [Cyanobacteria bacterium SZAS-4]|nr:hypothetical protein [Cyanobacteria bacterium SZAS-4]